MECQSRAAKKTVLEGEELSLASATLSLNHDLFLEMPVVQVGPTGGDQANYDEKVELVMQT